MGSHGLPPSLLLASSFRASDYLITPCMTRMASPYTEPEQLPQPLSSLRVVVPSLKIGPAGLGGAEEEFSLSVSTASIPGEAHWSSQRRSHSADQTWGPAHPAALFACSSQDGNAGCTAEDSSITSSTPPECLLTDSPGQTDGTAAQDDSYARPTAQLRDGSGGGSFSAGSGRTTHSGRTSGGSRGLGLQQQLELLEAKLLAEAEGRQALQHRLAEQRSEAEQQRQALEQQYAGMMAALRQELQQASKCSASGSECLSRSLLAGSQQLMLSAQEQGALRHQLAEQELLIKASQAENEMAIARMKQQAAEGQRQAAEAQQQIEELQQQLELVQQERECQLQGMPGVAAARLQELLRLQIELEGARAAAAEREHELRQRFVQLVQERDQAQLRAQEVQADSQQLREARQQLADTDRLVREQAQVISQMEQQLLHGGSASGGIASSAPPAAMQQLEAENASLRQTVQSLRMQLAHQVGTAQPAGGHHGNFGSSSSDSLVTELQAKLARLQAALKLKDEQYQRQLRGLRQEHERLKVQEGIRSASRMGAARVKELEARLEQVQEASARKLRIMGSRLKEAEAKCRKADPAAGSNSGRGSGRAECTAAQAPGAVEAPGTTRPVGRAAAATREALLAANTQLQQKEQRIRRLESEAARKDAELASITARAAHADEQLNAAAEQQQATLGEVAALQQAVEEVTAANDGLQVQVRQMPALRQQLAAAQQAAEELRRPAERLEAAEAELALLQQEQEEAVQQAASREAQHAAELRCLQQEKAGLLEDARLVGLEAAAVEWRPQVAKAEAEAAEWRGRVERLEQDLLNARAGLPWTPSAADFSALERRMNECQERALQREAHWRRVAEKSRQAAAAQQQRLQQRHEAALQTRDQQVDEFRQQLDGFLAAAHVVQAAAGGSES